MVLWGETGGCSRGRTGPKPCGFVVTTRDRFGNLVRKGGARLIVQVSGPTHPITAVQDVGDGSYQVSVRWGLSGAYALSVCVGRSGAHIQGSPFRVAVER